MEIERFALRVPSCMSVKTTERAGVVWEEARKIDLFFSPPPPRAIIADAHPLGTFENQDGRH